MEVRRNPIPWRHHKAHCERARFRRIAVEHCEFRSRWENRWCGAPFERIGRRYTGRPSGLGSGGPSAAECCDNKCVLAHNTSRRMVIGRSCGWPALTSRSFTTTSCSHCTPPRSGSSNLARQRGQCRNPLSLVARLSCSEVDSQGAELRGARRLWRARVDVSTPGDLEIGEPGRGDRCPKLCVQQSAGDSGLPEIDVSLAIVRDCFLHENVADLKATAGLEHARHFLQSGEFVGKEVQYAV
jgi:hypothetical protein